MKEKRRDSKGRFVSTQSTHQGLEKMISSKYPLSGGYFEIERERQQYPWEGDHVVTQAAIFLPVSRTQQIKKELMFEARLKIAGSYLYGSWGGALTPTKEYRIAYHMFSASTWSESFSKAQKWASEELGVLERALKDRAQALEDAEKPI